MVLEKDKIKRDYLDKIKNIWIEASDCFPDFLNPICRSTQAENEIFIQSVFDHLKKQLNKYPRLPFKQKKWKHKTVSMLQEVLSSETIICVHHYMDQQSIDTLQESLTQFLRHVRKFAPAMPLDGIGQAIRNYIVFTMFSEIHKLDHSFHRACFGYSMLYPFTDNYIDSHEISGKEKKQYNQLIKDKIEGRQIHPQSEHQKKTCDLLQMIELEYPRNRDLSISNLLLMMLDAQENSLLQQNGNTLLSYDERLDISLYKGGISVLIDGYFVNKELSAHDLLFYLEFGFFLQLADDLRDIHEDSIYGNQTIFTVDFDFQHQERIVNKMLHFIQIVMHSFQAENNHFKEFILTNCYQLIFSSVTESREFFSTEYLEHLEQYLPASCSFLDNIKHDQSETSNRGSQEHYMKMLDAMIF